MVSRQLASRPKLLTSTAPEDVDDDDTIDDDEHDALERARTARPRRTSTTSPGPAPAKTEREPKSRPAPKAPPAKKSAPKRSTSSRSSSSSSSRKPAAGGGFAHDGSGVVLGMLAYALFLAYIKGGWSGVRQWLAAKFLNKTGPSGAQGDTFSPSPNGGGIITPGNGGRPYRLVPVPGHPGQFSQEPLGVFEGGPQPKPGSGTVIT